MTARLPSLVDRVLAVYGGRERWTQARTVRATFSAGGVSLLSKGQLPLHHVPVAAELDFPRVRIEGLAGRQTVAWLEGDSARIASRRGETLATRGDARAAFRSVRRFFWWDRLDVTYFLGYTLWNDLTLPRLLLRQDVEWSALDESTLLARFPPAIPTHSVDQTFRFDRETGLLRRHEYTLGGLDPWIRAVTVVTRHRESDGVMYPCRRVTTLSRPNGRRFHWLVLRWLEIHAWRLSSAALG